MGFLVLASAGTFLSPGIASATLGDAEPTVSIDAQALDAQLSALPVASPQPDLYSIEQFNNDGFSVKEFVTKNGEVFAVAWKGIHKPDLKQILGVYYDEYVTAHSQHHKAKGRAPLQVSGPHSTFHSSGHMGAVRGHALATSLIPNGVALKDVHF